MASGTNYLNTNRTAPYLIATAVVVASVMLRMPLDPWLGPTRAAFLVPYCAVIFIAVLYGFLPALFTEILSLVCVVFFILPPRWSFKALDAETEANVLTFAVGAFACTIIGHLAYRSRQSREELALQLEQTVANAGTGLTRCDRDMRFVTVNPAFARFVGKPAKEIVGKRLADVLGDETMSIITPYIERALRGETVEYQAELALDNERSRTFNVHYAPEHSPEGVVVGWIASIDDITNVKTAEAVQARLAAIVDSSHDAIVSKDLDTIITSWNAGAERLFGYTPEEAVGRSIRILIPEERQDEETDIIGRVGRGETVGHYETIRRHKDGTLIPISLTVSPIRNANDVVIGASKIAHDITKQKLAEKRIAEDLRAMTRLRDIGALSARVDCDIDLCLEAILDAAIDFTHAAKGNIQLFRPDGQVLEIVRHSGFSDAFLHFFAAVGANDAAAFSAALQGLRRVVVEDVTKSKIFDGQPSLQALLSEGVYAVQSTPLVSSTGRALGMISTHFSEPHRPSDRELGLVDLLARQTADMIERRGAHDLLETLVMERTRDLNAANDALVAETESRIQVQEQRIDLLGRLVIGQEAERERIGRDIHDQLGQRLTGLRLQLQSLRSALSSQELDATVTERLEALDDIARKLDSEVSYLAWELQPTVLDQGLQETLRVFVNEWSKQYGVAAEFQAVKLEDSVFDKNTEINLYRITQEALNNIAKHADAKNVSVQLTRRNGMLSLIVEDNGCGFDSNGKPRNQDRLGGLGIRGMKERAELIGGEVEIQSKPGSGTTLFVRLAESSGLNTQNANSAVE